MAYTQTKRFIFIFFSLAVINGQADPPTVQVDSSVKDLMLALTIPASDYIWSIQEPPEDDAVWAEIRLSAGKLTESGNLLLEPSRTKEGEIWSQQARALIDAAGLVAAASAKKSIDDLFNAGDALLNTCASCHTTYLPK